MNNSFVQQFSPNIKFKYNCFDRIILRGSTSKTFWRLYDNDACIKHWFRGNSIKQYDKTGFFIHTETTINHPRSLGLKKPVLYISRPICGPMSDATTVISGLRL